MIVTCAHCGKSYEAQAGHVNRAHSIGAKLFCTRPCHWASRRIDKPKSQRKEEKRLYDLKYRADRIELLRAKKAAYYKTHFDREKERVIRKARMPKHVEYCRRPEYRAKKTVYDLEYRKAEYADFAEAWRILIDLEKEIRSQATAYERRVANGYYTRDALRRRRMLCQTNRSNSRQQT